MNKCIKSLCQMRDSMSKQSNKKIKSHTHQLNSLFKYDMSVGDKSFFNFSIQWSNYKKKFVHDRQLTWIVNICSFNCLFRLYLGKKTSICRLLLLLSWFINSILKALFGRNKAKKNLLFFDSSQFNFTLTFKWKCEKKLKIYDQTWIGSTILSDVLFNCGHIWC